MKLNNYIDSMMQSKMMFHFYSKSEIDQICGRWKGIR